MYLRKFYLLSTFTKNFCIQIFYMKKSTKIFSNNLINLK